MTLGIYGAGNLGRELYDIASEKYGKDRIIFIDDVIQESIFYNCSVYRFSELSVYQDEIEIIIANGTPKNRENLYKKVKNAGFHMTSLISSQTFISPTALIKEGTIMMPFSSVHSNATIEENCLIQNCVRVSHDVRIGRHSSISSLVGFGGKCEIGEKVFVGMGAGIREGITIERESVIGMGSVVIKNVKQGNVVAGNPAKILKSANQGNVFKN